MFDVVAIGNAMIDMFMAVEEDNVFSRIDDSEHMLCFRFGEKIHVESCRFLLGGNACNTVVGLTRLGTQAALCAEIGSDEFAQKIREGLEKENVGLTYLMQTSGALSSFAVSISYHHERTLFVDHVKRMHNFPLATVTTKWVYLTSLGVEWKEVYKNVLSLVEKNNICMALSPGTHQFEEEGLLSIKNALQYTEILFTNREEAIRIVNSKKQIVNRETMEDIKELLVQLQKMGPKVVSITDGDNGSYGIDKTGMVWSLEKFSCKLVEKTGAGDAYASGFLAAYMDGKDVEEAMRWGAVNAASVIEHIGAQEGLLTKERIQERLESHKEFAAKELDSGK